ncbi:MAG: hypothetical protein F4Y02_13450, partial [Chloroflexi bacterium]|nr:hypothetical protein [Chloroflexota bacterium]
MAAPRALISVYDKSGLEDLAAGLAARGWDFVASGGTAATLAAAGHSVLEVEDLTGAPEMLDGRVKTLPRWVLQMSEPPGREGGGCGGVG